MTAQHPNILYIGDVERGRALFAAVEHSGEGYVYLPADVLEALGMYVFYFPDVIVIDTMNQPLTALEAYHHLRSVGAAPMILLTSDERADGDDGVYRLPPLVSRDELLSAIRYIVQTHEYRF
jgi:CheY-like chemotaxis protein